MTVTPEFLADLAADSFFEDEIGEVQELGWFALFDLSHEEDINLEPWAILKTDNSGESTVHIAGDRAEVMKVWKSLSDSYADFYLSEIPALL